MFISGPPVLVMGFLWSILCRVSCVSRVYKMAGESHALLDYESAIFLELTEEDGLFVTARYNVLIDSLPKLVNF